MNGQKSRPFFIAITTTTLVVNFRLYILNFTIALNVYKKESSLRSPLMAWQGGERGGCGMLLCYNRTLHNICSAHKQTERWFSVLDGHKFVAVMVMWNRWTVRHLPLHPASMCGPGHTTTCLCVVSLTEGTHWDQVYRRQLMTHLNETVFTLRWTAAGCHRRCRRLVIVVAALNRLCCHQKREYFGQTQKPGIHWMRNYLSLPRFGKRQHTCREWMTHSNCT